MKQSKIAKVLLVAVLAVGLMALAGCAVKGGTNDVPANGGPQSTDTNADGAGRDGNTGSGDAKQGGGTDSGDVTSTAMVAYANGDQVLFVDQDTQTPYFPTNIDDARIIYNGQEIDEDDLVAGNIVKVTGNGAMLESYPGQYPGITQVEVIEQGSPADAEQYADIVDTVFAAPDQSQVPSGNLNYKTSDGDVSVMLDPYEFEWQWKTEDGQTSSAQADGSIADENGFLNKGFPDARIGETVDAAIAFSVNPTSVEIERTPLVKGGDARINPVAEDEKVPCTLGDDGAIALQIEANYLYEIAVDFPQGEADYAFYTTD